MHTIIVPIINLVGLVNTAFSAGDDGKEIPYVDSYPKRFDRTVNGQKSIFKGNEMNLRACW